MYPMQSPATDHQYYGNGCLDTPSSSTFYSGLPPSPDILRALQNLAVRKPTPTTESISDPNHKIPVESVYESDIVTETHTGLVYHNGHAILVEECSDMSEGEKVEEIIQVEDVNETGRDHFLLTNDSDFPSLFGSGTRECHIGDVMHMGWRNSMAVRPTNTSKVVHISYEERRFKPSLFQGHLGDQNDICVDIMNKTGIHIELQNNNDNGLTIMLSGKAKGVNDGIKMVIQHLKTQANTVLDIPKEYHSVLRGKNGQSVILLEKECKGVKISIPARNSNSTLVKIDGNKEGVSLASAKIRDIVDQLSKRSRRILYVSREFHPLIRGAESDRLYSIQSQADVRVYIPPANAARDEIVISGLREDVDSVCEIINSLYQDMIISCTKSELKIDRCKHKYICGNRGSFIQNVLRKTGVLILIPTASNANRTHAMMNEDGDGKNDVITLFGPTRFHHQAALLVENQAQSMIEETFEIPKWIHKHLKNKENLKCVFDAHPDVNVDFKRDSVCLEGPPNSVQSCFMLIGKMVKAVKEKFRLQEIPVESKIHSYIVGKNGSTINRIKQISGVENIKVPGDKGPEFVQIEGTPASISIAIQEIMDIVNKKENELSVEIPMESRYMSLLIGSNGKKIKELRDRFAEEVIISLPVRKNSLAQNETNGSMEELIKIRGSKSAVQECVSQLEELKKFFAQFSFVDVVYSHNFAQLAQASQNRYKRHLRQSYPTLHFTFPTSVTFNMTPSTSAVDSPKKTRTLKNAEKLDHSLTFCGIFNVRAHDRSQTNYFLSTYPDAIAEIRASFSQTDRNQLDKNCQTNFDVCLKFASRNETDQDLITLIGKKGSVDKAKIYLKKALSEISERITLLLEVEARFCPMILGVKGSRLVKICQDHEVKIHIPDRRKERTNENTSSTDQLKCTIEITGIMDRCQMAREAILDCIPMQHTLTLSKDVWSSLNRSNINLNNRFKSVTFKIKQVSQAITSVSTNHLTISLNGPRVDVQRAIDFVTENLQSLEHVQVSHENQETIELDVPYRFKGQIIGRRGIEVNRICEAHGVRIVFPPLSALNISDADVNGHITSCKVKITGTKKSIEAAKVELIAKIDRLESCTTETIEIHAYLVPRYIGSQGKNIKDLMSKFQVDINNRRPFNNQTEGAMAIFILNGKPENTRRAKDHMLYLQDKFLKEMPAERENKNQFTLNQPKDYNAYLLDNEYTNIANEI